DGIGADQRRTSALHHRMRLTVNAALHESVHRVDEAIAMLLGVKADDARPEQTRNQLFAPGANAHPLGVWPWNLPKADDRRSRQPLADHLRGQAEVIILNQHDWIFRIHLLTYGVRELLVDTFVLVVVAGAEDRSSVGHVT